MTLDDLCTRLDSAKELPDLWSAAMEYFATFGITSASYHHFPPHGTSDSGKPRVYSKGYPDNFVEDYIAKKLYRSNPIVNVARSSTKPFYWRKRLNLDDGDHGGLTPEEHSFFEWIEGLGISDGLAIPVFGPHGRDGYIGLGHYNETHALSEIQIMELQAACQVGHMVYIRLTEHTHQTVPLTGREREVLEWVAKGKSNSVIADILGISAHTVDAYLRRIYLKLGVSDRISAALTGIGNGLIHRFS